MNVRATWHQARIRLNLRRALAAESIADIKKRHLDFELVRQRIQEAGTDSLLQFGNGYTFEGGLYLQQNPEEFAALTLFLRERGPYTNYLEIGSASGGACLFLYRELGFAHVISVDDGRHPRASAQPEHFGQIKKLKQFVGDSHSAAARNFLEDNIEGKLDVAFIDGDHSFAGVWQDFQLVKPFCRPGSLVIFHDTLACEGVERTWRKSIKNKEISPLAEFVGRDKPLGIGVGAVI